MGTSRGFIPPISNARIFRLLSAFQDCQVILPTVNLSNLGANMTVSTNPRLLEQFQLQNGIFFPKNYQQLKATSQKQLWDKVGKTYYGSQKIEDANEDILKASHYQEITGKIGGLWNRFANNQHFETILEIGCGYGRASINLSKEKNLTCDRYYGIDISESLLRRLLRFKEVYDFYPSAEFNIICDSAETLPLEDNSVDLILSNAVLMHIEKEKVKKLMLEVTRVLKPGGAFILNNSFHNQNCPAHWLRNLSRTIVPFGANSIYLNQHSATEIERLLHSVNVRSKCPGFIVEPNTHYALLPEELGRFSVPFAHSINRSLKPSHALKGTLAYSYNAYSAGVLG
ncbi:class I SAM-dependent methyltransferase [Phormidesmis sp. 146-12]